MPPAPPGWRYVGDGIYDLVDPADSDRIIGRVYQTSFFFVEAHMRYGWRAKTHPGTRHEWTRGQSPSLEAAKASVLSALEGGKDLTC